MSSFSTNCLPTRYLKLATKVVALLNTHLLSQLQLQLSSNSQPSRNFEEQHPTTQHTTCPTQHS